jgi:hypothetical protein
VVEYLAVRVDAQWEDEVGACMGGGVLLERSLCHVRICREMTDVDLLRCGDSRRRKQSRCANYPWQRTLVGRLYLYRGTVVSKRRAELSPGAGLVAARLGRACFLLALVRRHGRVRVPNDYPGIPRALGPVDAAGT